MRRAARPRADLLRGFLSALALAVLLSGHRSPRCPGPALHGHQPHRLGRLGRWQPARRGARRKRPFRRRHDRLRRWPLGNDHLRRDRHRDLRPARHRGAWARVGDGRADRGPPRLRDRSDRRQGGDDRRPADRRRHRAERWRESGSRRRYLQRRLDADPGRRRDHRRLGKSGRRRRQHQRRRPAGPAQLDGRGQQSGIRWGDRCRWPGGDMDDPVLDDHSQRGGGERRPRRRNPRHRPARRLDDLGNHAEVAAGVRSRRSVAARSRSATRPSPKTRRLSMPVASISKSRTPRR